MRNKELMTLEPGAWMRQVFREFDRVFWTPELEVFERDHGLIARLDLPGLTKEDVKIEVVEGALTITGERKHETKEERPGWYSSERTYGKFYRAIPLPEGVNAAEIKGTFTNGVLEVTIPAAAKAIAPPSYKVPIEDTTEKKLAKAAA